MIYEKRKSHRPLTIRVGVCAIYGFDPEEHGIITRIKPSNWDDGSLFYWARWGTDTVQTHCGIESIRYCMEHNSLI